MGDEVLMKSLSAIARELGVSVATVSYVYNNKWRENRIHPDQAERIRLKLDEEQAAPDSLGRQLKSGRTQTMGVLLPHLDQPYFLKLLAGIEQRLDESDSMALLGIAHGDPHRQVALAERMLGRRVDALLICPRPATNLDAFVTSIQQGDPRPIVCVDNYLPGNIAPYVASDNRWGAKQAVEKMLAEGRRRILFLGGHSTVAALQDRHAGYCGALEDAGLKHDRSLIVWRDSGDALALKTVLAHFQSTDPPDAIFVTSYFQLFPFLKLLDELGLYHPHDVLLAGFDEPMETWAVEVVRHVVRGPLLVVQQAAAEIGHVAVDLAHAAAQGTDISKQRRLIRPLLSWQQDDLGSRRKAR
jgi:LacI family transcriptional regulator